MKVFNIEDFTARLEAVLTTQKGSMLDKPDFGFDWEKFRITPLSESVRLEFEEEVIRAFSYFTEQSLVDSLSAETIDMGGGNLQINLKASIDGKQHEIQSENIDFSSGVYSYVKFFEV